jgi:hypothetical protein
MFIGQGTEAQEGKCTPDELVLVVPGPEPLTWEGRLGVQTPGDCPQGL